MFKLKCIKGICYFIPPIATQKIRSTLVSIEEAERISMPFKSKSFTGGYFIGNTNDFHAFSFYMHGYYDWRNIIICNEALKYKKGDIIEVGANIGTETISFTNLAKKNNVNVHAFEPLPTNLEYIFKFKEYNGYNNLKVYDKLVSDKNSVVPFSVPQGNSSGSGFIINSDADKGNVVKEFEAITIDTFLSDMPSCSQIFVDVEGLEYKVLKGAEKTIEKFKPFLILEVNQKYLLQRSNVLLKDFYGFLTGQGYHCYYIGKFGLEAVDINHFQERSNRNWLCIHETDMAVTKKINNAIKYNCFNPLINFYII
ncbi:FkbM family methyltransferase [Polluticaenibacter yanchengensis]|uniref:FkbM family methyltransferase n=1 Tax=Polluticaenibacter yanchengensis TaxID=3014562 RepID=A0ABT4UN26_9BACT|nr:FkbM family methyltransferase [Chitinophagaceae bacterium LY-5]